MTPGEGALRHVDAAKRLQALALVREGRLYDLGRVLDEHAPVFPGRYFRQFVVERIYVGYWFWGRPSANQLWLDLQDLFRRTKADFDPTTAEAREAWEAARLTTA